jgi:hypothetical protein
MTAFLRLQQFLSCCIPKETQSSRRDLQGDGDLEQNPKGHTHSGIALTSGRPFLNRQSAKPKTADGCDYGSALLLEAGMGELLPNEMSSQHAAGYLAKQTKHAGRERMACLHARADRRAQFHHDHRTVLPFTGGCHRTAVRKFCRHAVGWAKNRAHAELPEETESGEQPATDCQIEA